MAFEPVRFGNYLLTAHLGHGGMANVYRARRQGPGGFERVVVIKIGAEVRRVGVAVGAGQRVDAVLRRGNRVVMWAIRTAATVARW